MTSFDNQCGPDYCVSLMSEKYLHMKLGIFCPPNSATKCVEWQIAARALNSHTIRL